MIKEVTGAEAMGYLSTRPTMIVTTLHASGLANAGAFGAYTNLSSVDIGIGVDTVPPQGSEPDDFTLVLLESRKESQNG